MHRKWIMIAAAVLTAWPASLTAQRPPRPPRPPREPQEARAWAYTMTDNRGRIGVVVKTDVDAETDKIGAKIEGVTPGGPAAKAGLKVGDIITTFNGTSLAGVKPGEEDESGPGTKLVEFAHQLEPGDTVRIEYRRGGDTKRVTLVAEDLGGAFSFVMPRMPEIMPYTERELVEPRIGFCFGDSWCDLDLVTLNPDLGEYFGTKEGVLVLKAPADSGLALKAGDVILSIGGRKPTSPSHAMRILRSYETGESVTIDVLRKQKRTTIAWKVPERGERRLRWQRAPEREERMEFRRRGHTGAHSQRV